MTPPQRAAFVLREGFGYPYERIAGLLHLSLVNSRQQVARAQRRLVAKRHRQPVDSIGHRRLVQDFLGAAWGGDVDRLEQVLLTTESGRAVGAARPAGHGAACVPDRCEAAPM
ncbi:sigma factor-like helix-turn-helix DNA-binding protein [Streptomyces canus]|uniref:sigma factor-like helix-turn-helix DNA-binding protein n=1 Tax=Streptomyces canus TaxID=58343 RepID=UPI00338DC30C